MTTFTWVAAAIIGTLSVARTTRLLIHDKLPPMVWLRTRILARYKEDSGWADLWECPFCVAPYLAAGMGVWAWMCDLNTVWWVVNGWWAASYVAAIIYAYDQPD